MILSMRGCCPSMHCNCSGISACLAAGLQGDLLPGGACSWWGGGVCSQGRSALGVPGGDPPGRLLLRAVRILLECILVFVRFFHSNKMKENTGKCRDQKATTFNHINDTEFDLQLNQF